MTKTSDKEKSAVKPQLQYRDGLGALARKLFNKVDGKIMSIINERGIKKVPIRRDHPRIELSGHESYQELINRAKEYDAKEFFVIRRKAPKSPLRLHYRIAAKAYRTIRDSLLYVGFNLYKIARRN